MTYQVLARKWRPRNFEDMVGQAHVLKTLSNALNTDRLHHAYLFTGTRGVGKTTLARILAKCLNCENGVSATPCNKCSACISIDEGRFVDLIEVDAASRAKVEETRDLMDNVQYAPSVGRYKVYLIDEIHMFSNHSFNALLKTLEEPPPHVKFLLATTEPKKLPITILSRCLQFNLKHLTPEQIGGQLVTILKSEGISTDEFSVGLLAKAADGSMRDALSLLDQAVAYNDGKLEQEHVRDMLGSIDSVEVDKLIGALVNNDATEMLEQIDNIGSFNADYDSVLSELLSRLHNIAVAQVITPDSDSIDDEARSFASELSREDVQLYYQIALNGRRDLYISPDQRSGFEMTMIRMLAFTPLGKNPITFNKPDTKKQGTQTTETSQATQTSQITEVSNVKPKDIKALVNENSAWIDVINMMELEGLTKEMASQCILKEISDKAIKLAISPMHQQFLSTGQKDRLIASLKQHYGEKIKVDITVEELSEETPSATRAREAKERHEVAVEGFIDDPDVKTMVDTFGGTLKEKTIQGREA